MLWARPCRVGGQRNGGGTLHDRAERHEGLKPALVEFSGLPNRVQPRRAVVWIRIEMRRPWLLKLPRPFKRPLMVAPWPA